MGNNILEIVMRKQTNSSTHVNSFLRARKSFLCTVYAKAGIFIIILF